MLAGILRRRRHRGGGNGEPTKDGDDDSKEQQKQNQLSSCSSDEQQQQQQQQQQQWFWHVQEFDQDPLLAESTANVTSSRREFDLLVKTVANSKAVAGSSLKTTTTITKINKAFHHQRQQQEKQKPHLYCATISAAAAALAGTTRAVRCWLVQTPLRVLQELLLPVGYPASVRPGYLEYQLYDALQGLCSYVRGVVCSAHVLEAAGVGNASATALGAAVAWAFKDGVGLLGGLCFSYLAAPQFDGRVKEFRLLADVANDVGLFLDMMAPYLVHVLMDHFGSSSSISISQAQCVWAVTSLSTLCKTVCGIAAGATKGSITQHFCSVDSSSNSKSNNNNTDSSNSSNGASTSAQPRGGNLADLNAKESTQETAVSLLGMLLGVSLAQWLAKMDQQQREENHQPRPNNNNKRELVQWFVFVVLTLVHVWANYKGVHVLRLRTLNEARAKIVLQRAVRVLTAMCDEEEEEENNNDRGGIWNEEDLMRVTRQLLQIDQVRGGGIPLFFPGPEKVHESLWKSCLPLLFPTSGLVRHWLPFLFGKNAEIEWNAPVADVLAQDPVLAQRVFGQHGERYLLAVVSSKNNSTRPKSCVSNYCCNYHYRNGQVLVSLLAGSTAKDELQAFVHALLVQQYCNQNRFRNNANHRSDYYSHCVQRTHQQVQWLFPKEERDEKHNHKNNGSNNDGDAPSLPVALAAAGWEVRAGQERLYLGFSRTRSRLIPAKPPTAATTKAQESASEVVTTNTTMAVSNLKPRIKKE